MENEQQPIANRISPTLVEYVCPKCGWYDLTGVFREFLPFVDHLIQDYCFKYHPMLSQPLIQPNGTVWFRKPGTYDLILGLPRYSPDSADWIAVALITLEELRSLQRSEIPTAEKLVSLVRSLNEEFQDQRNYLLNYEENLKEAGMDPKWLGKQGNQASFAARSMAGARWKLTSSSSRDDPIGERN